MYSLVLVSSPEVIRSSFNRIQCINQSQSPCKFIQQLNTIFQSSSQSSSSNIQHKDTASSRISPAQHHDDSNTTPTHTTTECVCQVCQLYPRVSQSWDCSLSCYNLLSWINSYFTFLFSSDSDKYLFLCTKLHLTIPSCLSQTCHMAPTQDLPSTMANGLLAERF